MKATKRKKEKEEQSKKNESPDAGVQSTTNQVATTQSTAEQEATAQSNEQATNETATTNDVSNADASLVSDDVIAKLKVPELKAALRELSLPVGGLKAALQQRLQEAYNKTGDGTSPVDGRDRINQDDVPTENDYARFGHEAIEDMYGCEEEG